MAPILFLTPILAPHAGRAGPSYTTTRPSASAVAPPQAAPVHASPCSNTHAVSSRTRYNVQTRHVSDVHVKIVHMRLQHGPLRARRLPRLCRTRYIGPQHDPGAMVASVHDACFESISRPANARRELQPVRPTASPTRQATLPKMHANPETVETITVNERVSMQEVVRGCGSSGRKEDPMQRRFRQDPMLERASSGPHA
jgi:hypothetical protein